MDRFGCRLAQQQMPRVGLCVWVGRSTPDSGSARRERRVAAQHPDECTRSKHWNETDFAFHAVAGASRSHSLACVEFQLFFPPSLGPFDATHRLARDAPCECRAAAEYMHAGCMLPEVIVVAMVCVCVCVCVCLCVCVGPHWHIHLFPLKTTHFANRRTGVHLHLIAAIHSSC